MKLNTKVLVNAALLVAMSIVLTRFASFLLAGGTIRIGLGVVPLYLAGLLFGPLVGGLVGGVADFVGYMINPFGSTFIPHIFLASVMRGVVPPLVARLFGGNERSWQLKILCAIIGAELISGMWLTTAGLAWIRQLPFLVVLAPRLIALAVQIPVYTILTGGLLAALRLARVSHQMGK